MKTKRLRGIILAMMISITIGGCKHEQEPQGIMDTATLADFLVEAQLIDSYRNIMSSYNRDSIDSIADAAFASLYAKYNITEAVYDSSISYYMNKKGVLESVYKRVIVKLQEQSENVQSDGYEQTIDSIGEVHRIISKMM